MRIIDWFMWQFPRDRKFLVSEKKNILLKELEAVAKSRIIKAYLRFYLDAEDSFEDDLDHYVAVKLFAFKASRYAFRVPYRTWSSDWERMLYDGYDR